MVSRFAWCVLFVAAVVLPAACVWAAEGGAEHAPPLNPLSPEAIKGDLAIWTFVVFVVLVAILGKFAWKPLCASLDQRERDVAEHIAGAERANAEAKQLLAQYEQKLVASQDEVRAMLEQGRRDAEQVGREMVAKAKTEAEAEKDRALKQIDAATASAIKELADRAAGLAVDLAGKIVQTKLNPRDHARLIEQAVAEFAGGNASKN